MTGPYVFEPRSTALSRDDVNQINKILSRIAKDVQTSTPAAAVPTPASNGAVNTGLPGLSRGPGAVNTSTENLTVGGENVTANSGAGGGVIVDGTTISGTGLPGAPLGLMVPFVYGVRSTSTTPDNVTAADVFVLASATAGANIVENLPAATGSGRTLIFKKMDSNAHNVVITRGGSDTIDGATTVSISVQYDVVRLLDGAPGAWSIW